MTTATLKLSYFDFPGGRGEPARIALNLAGIAFEDHRIPVTDWPAVKADFPYQQVPVMEVDGKVLNQSNAINRLVGKMADLYPQDSWEAAVCDDVMDTADDLMQLLVNTFFMPEEEKNVFAQSLLPAHCRCFCLASMPLCSPVAGSFSAIAV